MHNSKMTKTSSRIKDMHLLDLSNEEYKTSSKCDHTVLSWLQTKQKVIPLTKTKIIIIRELGHVKVAPQSFYKSDYMNWQDLQKKP